MKSRKYSQPSKRRSQPKGTKTDCPRCGKSVVLDIKYPDAPKGSEDVDCQRCGATLEVKYICSIEVDNVEVVDAPTIEIECPVCDTTIFLDDIEINSETGSTELECPGGDKECGAELEVSWSDWGLEVEIEILSEPEKEEPRRHGKAGGERDPRMVEDKEYHEEEEEEEEEEEDDEDDGDGESNDEDEDWQDEDDDDDY